MSSQVTKASTKEVFSPLSSLLLSNLSFSESTNSTLSLINIFEKWIHNSWSSWQRDKLINILHQQFHVWTLTILTHSLVLPRCEIISGVLLPVHNTTLFANVTRYLLWEDLSASVVPSMIQRQWIKHQLTIPARPSLFICTLTSSSRVHLSWGVRDSASTIDWNDLLYWQSGPLWLVSVAGAQKIKLLLFRTCLAFAPIHSFSQAARPSQSSVCEQLVHRYMAILISASC